MNLSTSYLGLNLKHPIIAGASPMVFNIDTVRRLEDAGAAAIVMHSLFEEQVELDGDEGERDEVYNADPRAEAKNFPLSADEYVNQLQRVKDIVDVPVIASLNAVREGNWVRYAQLLQDAGADALELNLYFLPRSDDESSAVVEQRAFQIVRLVRQFVSIPVAVKLSPFFTSLPHFAHRLEEAGAASLVMFNRFFQPDIDVRALKTVPRLELSTPEELHLRLRWLAVLHGRLRMDMSITGGVHQPEDVVKSLMVGADSVQVVSCLLKYGPEYIKTLVEGLEVWMEENQFENLDQMRGCMSYIHTNAAEVVGRANYIKTLQSWRAKAAEKGQG